MACCAVGCYCQYKDPLLSSIKQGDTPKPVNRGHVVEVLLWGVGYSAETRCCQGSSVVDVVGLFLTFGCNKSFVGFS